MDDPTTLRPGVTRVTVQCDNGEVFRGTLESLEFTSGDPHASGGWSRMVVALENRVQAGTT